MVTSIIYEIMSITFTLCYFDTPTIPDIYYNYTNNPKFILIHYI